MPHSAAVGRGCLSELLLVMHTTSFVARFNSFCLNVFGLLSSPYSGNQKFGRFLAWTYLEIILVASSIFCIFSLCFLSVLWIFATPTPTYTRAYTCMLLYEFRAVLSFFFCFLLSTQFYLYPCTRAFFASLPPFRLTHTQSQSRSQRATFTFKAASTFWCQVPNADRLQYAC